MALSTTVRCGKCKKELEITDAYASYNTGVTVEIEPCSNLDCINCKECEEVDTQKRYKKEADELKKIIKDAKEILK